MEDARRGEPFNVPRYSGTYLSLSLSLPPFSFSIPLSAAAAPAVRGNNNKCAARAWKRTDIRAAHRYTISKCEK